MNLRKLFPLLTFIVLLSTGTFVAFAAGTAANKTYKYSRIGNAIDFIPPTQLLGGTVLMGGGADVEPALIQMCENSLKGDFLIIGTAVYNKSYDSYIKNICRKAGVEPNSVGTLVIPDKAAANDPFVSATVGKAEAIWIAGGDQAHYITDWTGTLLQGALQAAVNNNVPIGGTSAGMNVLTPIVFSALYGGITSSEALADPNSDLITLTRDFVKLPVFEGMAVIGDPHFYERDRMGRDLAFLYRIYNLYPKYAKTRQLLPLRSIGVDGATALYIDQDGFASVFGAGNAYFLEAISIPYTCLTDSSLTLDVSVNRINQQSGSFAIPSAWRVTDDTYIVSADCGSLSSDQENYSIY